MGTTIAISTIPIALGKGQIINPLFIFEAKYRRYMGEYFLLIGFISMGVMAGMLFFFIPGLVISIAWSLAVLVFIDKGLTPLAAIQKSNELTYGYKWKIFAISVLLSLVYLILICILAKIPAVGGVLCVAALLVYLAAASSCTAVIYRDLSREESAEPIPAPAVDMENPFPEE